MCGIAGFDLRDRAAPAALADRLIGALRHRGPDGEGDLTKPGTFQAACEIVGVHAAGWNLVAVSAEREGTLDLSSATEADFALLTTNGCSNKESAWFQPSRKDKE